MDENVLMELEDKQVRTAVFENSFPLFFAYHYGWEFTEFQKERMESMESEYSTMLIGFRWSRKTTIARGFAVWCMVYKKESYMVRQSYEDSLSWASVREIAKMLCKKSIVDDYGMLFPFTSKQSDFAKKSLTNFETTNGVKIESKSLGQTLRWSNTYDMVAEVSSRPTLLFLDDIDVVKSVGNVDIIKANEDKITNETIGSLDPLKRKVIFLWNVINEDGVVPRFWERYHWANGWNCFWQPLFDKDGNNVRPEVFTDEVVATLRVDGKTSMNQNYYLIPSSVGSGIFTRNYFDYFLLSHFEEVDWPLKKQDLYCGIIIDPAFSTSNNSDDAAVGGMGMHTASKKIYLIDLYADTSAQSKTIQAVIVMYNKMTMDWFTPKFVSVENVTINKQQTQFIKELKDELVRHWINIPVYSYESKINKNTRIQDSLEGIMSQQGIKFNRSIDKNLINKMETQFLEFPNGDHDDIIDMIAQWAAVFRKWVQPKPKEEKPKINPLTGQYIKKNNNLFGGWSKDRRD
jgi:predicted phage terminase large subunit-like protein